MRKTRSPAQSRATVGVAIERPGCHGIAQQHRALGIFAARPQESAEPVVRRGGRLLTLRQRGAVVPMGTWRSMNSIWSATTVSNKSPT